MIFSRVIRGTVRTLTLGWKRELEESGGISFIISLMEVIGGASSSAKACRGLAGGSSVVKIMDWTANLELSNIESVPKSVDPLVST